MDGDVNPTQRLHRNGDVVFRALGGDKGGVLLHVKTAAYHGVNDLGAQIWDAIDGTRSTQDVTAHLRAEMPDAPARMEQDVAEFISSLVERDLVRVE